MKMRWFQLQLNVRIIEAVDDVPDDVSVDVVDNEDDESMDAEINDEVGADL